MDLSESKLIQDRPPVPVGKPPALIYSPHPLLPAAGRQIEYAHVIPGETIAEYFDRIGLVLHGPAVLHLNGYHVPRGMWKHTRPKPGMLITLRATVAGGGGGGKKNPMATVLQIALLVAAPGLGAAAANAFGLSAASTAFSVFGQAVTWGRVIGGAIALGGGLVINSLLPPPKPALAQAQLRGMDAPSPTYSLTGGSNRARTYQPLPLPLGKHRVFPDLGAKEYTEFEGDDQYLYQSFNYGFGDLILTDFRIGETALSSYNDVRTEIAGADGSLHLFPNEVDTTAGGELVPATDITRTSSAGATQLAIEITGSLFWQSDAGLSDVAVKVRMDYRLSGSTDWLPFALGTDTAYYDHYWSAGVYNTYVTDPESGATVTYWQQVDFDRSNSATAHYDDQVYSGSYVWRWRPYTEIGGSATGGTLTENAPPQAYTIAAPEISINSASTKPLRLTYKRSVPAGQYEVRVRRTTEAYTDGRTTALLVWSQLRSYIPDTTDYTGQNRVALKIRASGQISGTVQQFSALVSARCPVWDGASTWTQRETSNPAWWFLYVARGASIGGRPAYGAGMADSRIDIDGIKAFGAWCDAKGLTFNAVLDSAKSCQDLLEAIARIGRGSISGATGKLGVVWDAPDQAVSAVYGMGNIIADSYRIEYVTDQLAEEIVCTFINPDNNWGQDQVRALVPGVTTPRRTSTVDLWGVTNKTQAGKEALLLAADQYYHNARLYFDVDREGFVNQRGDTILLAHDIMRSSWGYSGRLVEGSTASVLKFDRKVPFTAGQTHYVLVKKPDGSFGITTAVYAAGENDSITLGSALSYNPSADPDGHPVYDYVWFFDLRPTPGRRVKIIDLRPQSLNRISVAVQDDDADYYAAESGSYTHAAITPRGYDTPVLSNLEVTETLVRAGQGYVVRLTVTWDVSGRYDHAVVRASVNGEPMKQIGTPFTRRQDFDVPDGSTVQIQVTGVHPLGFVGTGAIVTGGYTVIGAPTPDDVPWASIDGGRYGWGQLTDPTIIGYRIHYQHGANLSWADAAKPFGDIVTASPVNLDQKFSGPVTIMVKAVNAYGKESLRPAYVITDLGDPIVANVVETIDLHALGFPGTTANGSVVAGDLVSDNAVGAMWSDDENAAMWTYDTAAFWNAVVYKRMTYIGQVWPLSSGGLGSKLTLDWTVAADVLTVSYRRNAPGPMWTIDSEPLWTADTDAMWSLPPGNLPRAMWTDDAAAMWSANADDPMWQLEDGGFQAWPGSIDVQNEPYDICITTGAGPTQATISALSATIDMPDIVETFNSVSIAATTGTRLPTTKTWRSVTAVNLTLENDGGTAVGLTIEDYSTAGPLIKGRDTARAVVATKVSGTIQGY